MSPYVKYGKWLFVTFIYILKIECDFFLAALSRYYITPPLHILKWRWRHNDKNHFFVSSDAYKKR